MDNATTATSFSLRTDLPVVPAGAPATRYVLVSLTAPDAPRSVRRPPINVSLVLDRSGSMAGKKIRLAHAAVKQVLRMLNRDDRFSVVVYDDRVDIVVPTTEAGGEARRRAVARLAEIDARGNTDLAGGWLTGCEQVAPTLAEEPSGRCFLLTDGLANVGITDAGELAARAEAFRTRHIVTSTFGIGADFDEDLLQALAERSGGHFYFVESAVQIPDVLTSELGEALQVVARDATLAVQVPAGVRAVPLARLEWCATDSGIRIALGDLVSGQAVDVVVRLDLPAIQAGAAVGVKLTLADHDSVLACSPQEAVWTSADPAAVAAATRDRLVDRAVAELYAARARHDAVRMNKAGEFAAASALLRAVAARIEAYAGDDEELRAMAARLRSEAERFGEVLPAPCLKAAHFQSYSVMQGRDVDGRVKRHQSASSVSRKRL